MASSDVSESKFVAFVGDVHELPHHEIVCVRQEVSYDGVAVSAFPMSSVVNLHIDRLEVS